MITSYPKVYALGHRYIEDILDGDVVVEEKIDGSQISFGVYQSGLKARSKGQELFFDNPEKMFAKGLEQVKARADKLIFGFTYRGEYLQKPKHNTLNYSRIPKDHIIIFDIEDVFGNPVDRTTKEYMAADIGLEVVPGYVKSIKDREAFNELLGTESILGGEKIEGVVIKNYSKFTEDKKFMAGKFVSERFKERHGKEWKVNNPGKNDIIQNIISELKTEARYQKGKQALINNGEFTNSPADIGKFLKALHADIDAEEKDYIANELYRHFIAQIKRGVCAGAAEWYKESIMADIFRESEE